MSNKPLYNSDIEQAVLNYFLNYGSCLHIAKVSADWFYDRRNRRIFDIIKSLQEKGVVVEPLIVVEAFEAKYNDSESVLISIIAAKVPVQDIEYSVDKLEDFYKRREVYLASQKLMDRISDLTTKTQDILIEFDAGIENAVNQDIKVVNSTSIVAMRQESLEERKKAKIVKTGYKDLDRYIIQGFHKGNISVIAGRPGMGKSTLKLNILSKLGVNGFGAIDFCMDDDDVVELDRLNSMRTRIPLKEILTSKEWEDNDPRYTKLMEDVDTIKHWNMSIIHFPGITMAQSVNIIRKYKRTKPLDVVFYDLFDNLSDIDLENPNRIKKKLRELKDFANMLDVHICLIVQIRRMGRMKKIEDWRPTMEDLKDSGAFEEVSRLVLLLFRPKYYDKHNINDDIEIIIAKQNNGPTGSVFLDFDETILRMSDKQRELY